MAISVLLSSTCPQYTDLPNTTGTPCVETRGFVKVSSLLLEYERAHSLSPLVLTEELMAAAARGHSPSASPGTAGHKHCSSRWERAAWSTVEHNISTLSVRTALPADYSAGLETPNCNTAAPPSQAPTDSSIQTAGEATEQFVYVFLIKEASLQQSYFW